MAENLEDATHAKGGVIVMADSPISDCTVIVRHCGERTFPATVTHFKRECGCDEVHCVSDVPFSKTLRNFYELAVAKQRTWTISLDGDAIPTRDAIVKGMQIVRQLDPSVFEAHGFVLDWFSGGTREGGMRFYRTEHLPLAISLLGQTFEKQLRPESFVVNEMKRRGFPNLAVPDVFAIHDFFQYRRDIYRKAYFFANKWDDASKYWSEYWQESTAHYEDFKVALLGYEAGRAAGRGKPDLRSFDFDQIEHDLTGLGLEEKPPLTDTETAEICPESMLRDHIPSRHYWAWRAQSRKSANHTALSDRIRGVPKIKVPLFVAGKAMRRMGNSLIRIAED